MIKLLIGGSPCTHWSIAQSKNRETEPSGIGWELFKNYLIAKEKFAPDYFLYENNKSVSPIIKAEISRQLGVSLVHINSALVSGQNRQRFYAVNWETNQPLDRGIMLRDVLETGEVDRDKAHCLKHQQGNARDYFKKKHTQIVFEPFGENPDGKAYCLDANYGKVVSPEDCLKFRKRNQMAVAVDFQPLGRKKQENGEWVRIPEAREDGKSSALTSVESRRQVAEKVFILPREDGEQTESKPYRVYGVDGKSVTICGEGGGGGAKTGLYAVCVAQMGRQNEKGEWVQQYEVNEEGKTNTLTKVSKDNLIAEPRREKSQEKVYEVKNGQININGKLYPIKLADGYWIIRKLTPVECERLQTMPDGYTKAVSDTQRYRGLGNGWTAEVIIHLLNGVLKDVPRDEKIVVLSMYDGIGTGRYCLDKMGFTNVEYHAYEIDKYAIKVAMSNYPDIIQHGDAFAVREEGWRLCPTISN